MTTVAIIHQTSQPSQTNIPSIFVHLSDWGVIICKACQFAVVPTQTIRHLNDHHPTIPDTRRKVIQESISRLEGIIIRYEDIRYPRADDKPIANLPVHKDGLRCKYRIENDGRDECGYICTTLPGMTKHCREKHNWRSDRSKGGSKKQRMAEVPNKIWEEGIHCQRFFEFAKWKKYFQIKIEGVYNPDKEQEEQGKRWAEGYRKEMERRGEGKVIEGLGGRYKANL